MADIDFSGVASDTDVRGTLFQGIKFWISQQVPQRKRFQRDVEVNGGEILPLEKYADVRIVDHARKQAPPGTHSYTFIEKSIRNGVLEDLDDYKVGPPEGNVRSIGSVVQPPKGTRNKFTEADDRVLWDWVNDNPQKGGGTDGNEIYKQLEQKHPQHPWQSWRDRWIRHLKGKKAPFPLPHNAPPTPPFDVPPTTEFSKDRATSSNPAEDDYKSFSEDDAEALMAKGDDIVKIRPDRTTEAWESWARDYDKDISHTAQQWRSYWEESVRPRYIRRKAKQTRRASPEKTIPTRSEVTHSPNRTGVAPLSAFSPSKEKPSLMPDVPQKTVSKVQKSTSLERSMAAPPSRSSPDFQSPSSLILESPVKYSHKFVSPKRPVVSPSWDFLASNEKGYSLKPANRSPSDHPESPTMIATALSKSQKATDILSEHVPSLPSINERHIPRTPKQSRSPHRETIKRKHVATEEDLPSSSPIGPMSPKRGRQKGSEFPVEIASTPEKGREPFIEEISSPLSIKLELEEDEPGLPAHSIEYDSPLGQQVSDSLSEPSHIVNNTQAVLENATPFIDFDIPAPEGGWNDEEFLVQDSSQPLSIELPIAEDIREDNKHGIKDLPQVSDFDLAPILEGQNKQEPDVKSEPESPATEIYDPQPTLRDTQAILESKTPAPDFSIPDPDGGWRNAVIPSSSSPAPDIPSSPRAESVFSHTELRDQLDAWIDAHAIRGISVERVESVLKSTSMDTALAHKALRYLRKKGALPPGWRGVWTAEDDEDLKSTDARKIQRLQEKHGADCLAARWEFLDFYAAE